MTSLPSVFQLGSDQQWHFAEQKKRTLEPFKDFPAFFGGLAGCMLADKGGSRRPYPVVLGYMAYNVLEVSSSCPDCRISPSIWVIMAPARPCGICTLILVTICKVYIYIYIQYSIVITFRN